MRVCDGCAVREPWEHRCFGRMCPCEECRLEDRIFGARDPYTWTEWDASDAEQK